MKHPTGHCQTLRKKALPSIDQLRRKYAYDPETGIITNRDGKPIGTKTADGYTAITASAGIRILRARLAYALQTGEWPNVIDHIDGERSNDRWTNLRNVSQLENMANRKGTYTGNLAKRGIAKRRHSDYANGFAWVAHASGGLNPKRKTHRTFCDAWRSLQDLRDRPPSERAEIRDAAAEDRDLIGHLKRRFRYDPDTGEIFGRRGKPIGSPRPAGYIAINVVIGTRQRAFMRGRLAYALMTGEWPNQIDHIDRDRANDRWSNLRNVTPKENIENRSIPSWGICKVNRPAYSQGFVWKVHNRQHRDFCAAWHTLQHVTKRQREENPHKAQP